MSDDQEIKLAFRRYEAILIAKIAKRARELGDERPADEIEADIAAVQASDCPMRLMELFTADDFDFRHDVDGIARHLDRKTGELGPFWPRCARPREAWDPSQGSLH